MADTTTWIVTGANRGIGLGLTKRLLGNPSNVVVATARSPDAATELRALKDTAEGTLHVVALDVADEASIKNSVKAVEQLLGENSSVDYLFNNAGILNPGVDTAFTLNPDILMKTIKTNVVGPALLAQAYLPHLLRSKKKTIVNVSSALGSIGRAIGEYSATYSISKSALNMLTFKQKREREDICAVALDPGWVRTEMTTGEPAPLSVEESVSHFLPIVLSLTPQDSGKFFSFDGTINPW